MAQRIVLHVGLMKSGTSFLQQVLQSNRRALRRRGVLFPGPWRAQVLAVRDIIAHGGRDQDPLEPDGAWRRLMGELDAWAGTAVVSMEFLGPRQAAKIRDIVRELPETELEVVLTVRDLARTIPAMWQENVQNGGHRPWEEYLAAVGVADGAGSGPGAGFWHRQDAAAILGRWQAVVGDRVSVVTVPPRGAPPALLWERFASLVPVDPGGLDLEVAGNPSLGLASLEVLRGLNRRLDPGGDGPAISPGAYERTVKRQLAKRGLAHRSGEPRLGYEEEWVVRRAEDQVERLRALGVRVVGDLAELRAAEVRGVSPEQVGAPEQLEAALDALSLLVRERSRPAPRGGSRRGGGGRRGR